MYSTAATAKELAFNGPISQGASGLKAKRVQEWLSFHDFKTSIDSDFGPATESQVRAFQTKNKLPVTGVVNQATWDVLVDPLVTVLSVSIPKTLLIAEAILKVAKAHLKVHPIELGGNNMGPWVRVYTDGNDGVSWKWCAGFVSFVMKQAATAIGVAPPIAGSVSCDTLAAQAKNKKRFIPGTSIANGANPWASLGVCQIFLIRHSSTDWTHTGFAFAGQGDVFTTIEGNANNDGGGADYEVCERQRGLSGKDFIKLI